MNKSERHSLPISNKYFLSNKSSIGKRSIKLGGNMDNDSIDLSDPFIGLSKKQRTSLPGGFMERGSIVSSISRKTCESSKSGISILSKMSS
jgi:hypothetical protein